ncbi:hypothetical protein ABT242_001268 [Campylobacter jejuni]|uniref:Uncharacterized protein n=2 Tax=Campylobacter TaxID=194 RepID=A0A5T1IKB4_CAMJU|nr:MULTISPECIES: hypothetical protein [Campylobacter]EAH5336760.1 hypothetical protein [Campylobacter jejuni]EAH5380116.1 hypothetical protein [Campylobacter jejuni]EAH5384990.1 hypothetical protein [Campylobacter jejuni]EAH5995363.1 hypothetical protein [Campylobacter coli]EAH6107159.1 hypothetical protein [Campylobacter coli]
MKLKLNLENCYGIGKLQKEFDFSDKNVLLFYAQNGIFKTSFAKTFKNIKDGKQIKDEIFPERISKAYIEFNGEKINKEDIFVFDSYDREFDSSKSVTTFMASPKLKKEYDEIFSELDKQKKSLLKSLKKYTGSSDCEKEILKIFSNKNLYQILSDNIDFIKEVKENYEFKYHDIFDDKNKVKEFVDTNKELLQGYFDKYNEILLSSEIFKKTENGEFGTHKIKELQNTLSDDRFFLASHKLLISNQEITTSENLNNLIQNEIDRILENDEIKNKFDDIEKKITKNQNLKDFKEAINANKGILLKLINYEEFRKEVIFSYLNKKINEIEDLVSLYENQKEKIQKIINNSKLEQESWKKIIEIFNSRFIVPFEVGIENQDDILLKNEVAKFVFKFKDNANEKIVNKEKLEEILSNGEKRALYILQILFEIEAQKNTNKPILLIFDDIVDSFDYRNKHAVVEYLDDIRENINFKIIIMTHNFDFYRAIARFGASKFMIHRNDEREIVFGRGEYTNEFIKSLKKNDENIKKNFITLIPFVRNILEYTKNEKDKEYLLLTSCLHMKDDTKNIKVEQALNVLKNYIQEYQANINKDDNLLDFIYGTCDEIANTNNINPIELQNKIVLSIGIRLKAEEFMLSKVNLQNEITRNQTRNLYNLTKEQNAINDKQDFIIRKVLAITSDNIHINSFMYEPILDTSIEHLVKLYRDIKEI